MAGCGDGGGGGGGEQSRGVSDGFELRSAWHAARDAMQRSS